MRMRGLEPPQDCSYSVLSAARLPFRHVRMKVAPIEEVVYPAAVNHVNSILNFKLSLTIQNRKSKIQNTYGAITAANPQSLAEIARARRYGRTVGRGARPQRSATGAAAR